MTSWATIRQGLNLEEVENALGLDVIETGNEHMASCPLPTHPGEDVHPSFSINTESYAWYCFTCGEGGALWQLVAAVNSTDYDGAIEWLTGYSDLSVPTDKWLERFRKRIEPKEIVKVEREPTLPWFPGSKVIQWKSQLHETDYFTQRGISVDTQMFFDLGYDPAYRHSLWDTSKAVIIPHHFRDELVGWQARTLEDKKPKYVNSPDFPKKDTLYNWDYAAKIADTPLVVVESPMTVLRLWDYDMLAVATFGASISDRQVQLLSSRQGPVFLSYDNDQAGQKAVAKLANALRRFTSVMIVPPPPGEKGDLGDCERDDVQALLDAARPVFLALPSP